MNYFFASLRETKLKKSLWHPGYGKQHSGVGKNSLFCFFVNIQTSLMPDSLYGACLQGFTVVVFIVAKSRAWFDEYNYHDSLQVRAIEGIRH